MSVRLGPYRIHLDALLARVLYRWRVETIIAATALLLIIVGPRAVEVAFDVARPTAEVTIVAPDGATVWVDGTPWDGTMRVGAHVIEARRGDQTTSRSVIITDTSPVTITLPDPWPSPIVNEAALPTGASLIRVQMTAAGVRLDYQVEPPPSDGGAAASSAAPRPRRVVMVATNDRRVEPFVTGSAYDGLYDEARLDGRTTAAWVEPSGGQRSTVVLQWEAPGDDAADSADPTVKTATAFMSDVSDVLADPLRRQAILVQYRNGVSQLTQMRSQGALRPIGAVRGELRFTSWTADYRTNVMVFFDRGGDGAAATFALVALDMEPDPTLVALSTMAAPDSASFLPALALHGDVMRWGDRDADGWRVASVLRQDRRIHIERRTDVPLYGILDSRADESPILAHRIDRRWSLCTVFQGDFACVSSFEQPADPGMTFFALPSSQHPPVIVAVSSKRLAIISWKEGEPSCDGSMPCS